MSQRLWIIFTTVVLTENEALEITREAYPDHVISNFTEELDYITSTYKYTWYSVTKGEAIVLPLRKYK